MMLEQMATWLNKKYKHSKVKSHAAWSCGEQGILNEIGNLTIAVFQWVLFWEIFVQIWVRVVGHRHKANLADFKLDFGVIVVV